MAELKKIQFLIFVLSTIFPAHALDVIFSSALQNFKLKSEIRTHIDNGEKVYGGMSNPSTYQPKPETSKVIVYIIDRSRFVEIARNAVREIIFQIAQELSEWLYELAFLGIENFNDDEYHLISAFMLHKIQPRNGAQRNFIIEIIGENHFDRVYPCYVSNFEKYQENAQVCGGTLKEHLRDIARGALKPVGSNDKEIRLYGFHPTAREVNWPISVENGTYSPAVNVSDPKYNFRLRSKTKKICLLILGGLEYSKVIKLEELSALKTEMAANLNQMTKDRETLLILGAFNFDWTEIDLVTQIILHHSIGWHRSYYNVFTCGYGIFDTIYSNVYQTDGRRILKQPKSNVLETISVLMRKEVKQRAINMYYAEYGWKFSEIPIQLKNGRYFPAEAFKNYTIPWVNQKIAFIVYDPTETNGSVNVPMVYRYVEELQRSGIYVVVIKAINFGFYDTHIVAEWIDRHRGVIGSEQIAVLGAGIFDTIFQSESTTYKTLFHTKKNELNRIRNAYVKSAKTKCVLTANLFDPTFKVWEYPMNTVNGFYEPDLMPDENMFGTGGKKIFFIVTSANRFHQISAMENVDPVTPWLRRKIEFYFLKSVWSVFLVGLDNFGEQDHHLFAELVKKQTHDERSLHQFVRIFNYGIGHNVYRYKDSVPFPIETRQRIKVSLTNFFEFISGHADGTASH